MRLLGSLGTSTRKMLQKKKLDEECILGFAKIEEIELAEKAWVKEAQKAMKLDTNFQKTAVQLGVQMEMQKINQ